ncbi:MAG: pantoate--beta-alanine ligase [Schleiferiaceae bacterium]
MTHSLKVLRNHSELDAWRSAQERVAFVPTMGALHAGHMALVERAAADGSAVLVSIFVNPTQFNRPEDLSSYPRDAAGDLATLGASQASAVWFPEVADLYPDGVATANYDLLGLDTRLEGALRPGHFQGVATVVDRLFTACRPDKAYFGLKDFQQVAVVRRVAELRGGTPIIVSCPTTRESDGLAMSSRNRLLTKAQRAAAPAIYRALQWAAREVSEFPVPPKALKRELRKEIELEQELKVEAIDFVFSDTLEAVTDPDLSLDRYGRSVQTLISVYAGEVRLIDNAPLYLCRR